MSVKFDSTSQEETSQPLQMHLSQLTIRWQHHEEMYKMFKQGSKNYEYHRYCYLRILKACKLIESCLKALPSDFGSITL